ncbi:hypothetical protein Tcan_09907 [Toxocara canis]|uniref:Uncharacterized protein n=1 Tax=Toxocara canis TaxID=6265 RepID=A0A0B2VD29_TOXCA|nr:hypothetical protein Tcan_09907 [Toxocara canis]
MAVTAESGISASQFAKNLSPALARSITSDSSVMKGCTEKALLLADSWSGAAGTGPVNSVLLQSSAPLHEFGSKVLDANGGEPEDAQTFSTRRSKERLQVAQMSPQKSFTELKNAVRLTSTKLSGVFKTFGNSSKGATTEPRDSTAVPQGHMNQERNVNEPRDLTASSKKLDQEQVESVTFSPGPTSLANRLPSFCTLPVPQFPLNSSAIVPAYSSSSVSPTMRSLMHSSVGWWSVMLRPSLQPSSPRFLNDHVQPVSLSRGICAPFVAHFPPSPMPLLAETSQEGYSPFKRVQSGRTVESSMEKASSAAVSIELAWKEPDGPTEPSKHTAVRMAVVKRNDAPNITVRMLPAGMNFVSRNITPLSKRRREMESDDPVSFVSSPATSPSPARDGSERQFGVISSLVYRRLTLAEGQLLAVAFCCEMATSIRFAAFG